jgi:anti-sigma factor RsiW
VAKKHSKAHLTAERIQAFLDEALSEAERAEVQEHATFCGRCQAELETWQLLYFELGELPELSPAPNFRDRVLAGLDTAVPAAAGENRLLGWLRRGAVRAAEHLDPERLQDYVEGLLPARQMARVSAHLDSCGVCRSEEAQWRGLIQGIEQLPVMAPSSAFAGRVMGQVRLGRLVRPVAARNVRGRALAWVGRLIPQTQRTWAVISGIAFTPITVVALLTYAVFSNPLVTPAGLASFLWWRISSGATAMMGFLADGLLESPVAFFAYSGLDLLAGAPAITAMIAVSFSALTGLATWVLYRNLMTTRTVDGKYARASV